MGFPVSHVPTFTLARAEYLARMDDKGGPYQLNSLLSSHEWLDRGSKADMIRKSPVYVLSFVPCPHRGEVGQRRTQPSYISHSHPLAWQKRGKCG